MPIPSGAWTPTEADLTGLGEDGRVLIDRVLEEYEPSLVDGMQLLEAARAADVLAQLRAGPSPDLRQIRLWSGYYTALIRMLGLT